MSQAELEIKKISLRIGMKVWSPKYGRGEIDHYLERGHRVGVWFRDIREIKMTSLRTCRLWRYREVHKKFGILTREGVLRI